MQKQNDSQYKSLIPFADWVNENIHETGSVRELQRSLERQVPTFRERDATLEEFVIPKGTRIQIAGLPFQLSNDTNVKGLRDNYDVTLEKLGTKE